MTSMVVLMVFSVLHLSLSLCVYEGVYDMLEAGDGTRILPVIPQVLYCMDHLDEYFTRDADLLSTIYSTHHGLLSTTLSLPHPINGQSSLINMQCS